jgi:hypothetical protein
MSTVPQVGRSQPERSKHSARSGKLKLAVAGGVAATLSLAIGAVWLVKAGSNASTETMTVSTVRPVEIVRYAPVPVPEKKTANSTPTVPPNVQPPQGTIRRMEAISGTFKK